MKKLTDERKAELKKEVREVCQRFISEFPKTSEAPIPNSFKAAEELGFFVIAIPAPDNISGMTMNMADKSMIVVNSKNPLGRQNYSIWHEVYHWYSEDGQDISFYGESEYDETEFKAEFFASEILMPEESLIIELIKLGYSNKQSFRYLKIVDIVKLQNIFNVSYKALLTRIIDITGIKSLKNRYGAASNQEKVMKLNKDNGYSGNLEMINQEPYISESLFIYMNSNLKKGRVSSDRVKTVLDFIEEEFN